MKEEQEQDKESKSMEKTMKFLLMAMGVNIKAPKPLRNQIVEELELTNNPEYKKIESIFKGIEDKQLKHNIFKALLCTQFTPVEYFSLRDEFHNATERIIAFVQEHPEYRSKTPKEEMLKEMLG